MKILYVTPWFPRHREDQVGNFILDSVESLAALGHEVDVLLTEPWKGKKKRAFMLSSLSDKIHLHSCHYLSIPRSYLKSISTWSYRTRVNPIINKLVRHIKPDIIHAHTELPAVSAIAAGYKFNIPTVMTIHGISSDPKLYAGQTRKLLFENTLVKANRVILVGKPLRSFAEQFVKNQDHFRIIPNGFRIHTSHASIRDPLFSKNTVRFISVSNLVEGKGIDINIHAFARLKASGIQNWSYQIIGEGVLRTKLEKLANSLNLNEQIQFIGGCQHNKVFEYLSQSDVFILPSSPESFGVAYVEAMSCGLLTIGVKGQGPEDYIHHDQTGLLVNINPDELADVMKSIFMNQAKMKMIAEAGRDYVHHYVTWQSHANKLMSVYHELIQ